jgi:hypothetical protein
MTTTGAMGAPAVESSAGAPLCAHAPGASPTPNAAEQAKAI